MNVDRLSKEYGVANLPFAQAYSDHEEQRI